MQHILALWAITMAAAFSASPPAAAAEPELVITTARSFEQSAVDTTHAVPISEVIVERPGLSAVFHEGQLHPVRSEAGELVGAVFIGQGTFEAHVPAGVETSAWETVARGTGTTQDFDAAWLRFSDDTWAQLSAGAEVQEVSRNDAVFRLDQSRSDLIHHPRWTRSAPNLLIDRLHDIFGGVDLGGHLLASFRLDGPGASWLSYLHNPRGGLLQGETTQWFQLTEQGEAPPYLKILSSFGAPFSPHSSYEIDSIALDVVMKPERKGTKLLRNANIEARIDLINNGEVPLATLEFELEQQRLLCASAGEQRRLNIDRVVDDQGRSLGAVHRGSRLLVALIEPLDVGERALITIDYSGPVTQQIPGSDALFTELGPWAWYPRNLRLDRHASRITVHLPRFLSAVATGDLVEERKEDDGWHFTYAEPAGVRTLGLVVGDLVHSKEDDQGQNPRIITWYPRSQQEYLSNESKVSRQFVDFVSSVWGGYPYTTLHVIQSGSYPANNWTDTAEWTCTPPSTTQPWQNFVEAPSGMLVGYTPTTAPAHEAPEGRAYSQFIDPDLETMRVMALTRQWWGHLVPPRSYRDLWIGESLAAWTAVVYTRTFREKTFLKERMNIFHNLMVDSPQAAPLALGGRLAQGFPFQVWGRGPLLMNLLLTHLSARPFLTMTQELMREGASQGLGYDLLLAEVRKFGGEDTWEQVRALAEHSDLPEVEYRLDVDKKAKRVTALFHQITPPRTVDVTIELKLGGGVVETRVVRLKGEWTPWELELPEAPRKVIVDPVGATLVRSLSKNKKLEQPPPTADEQEPS